MASPRKPDKNKKFRLHVAVDGADVIKLDDIAKKRSALVGIDVTRSDIARIAISEWLARGSS